MFTGLEIINESINVQHNGTISVRSPIAIELIINLQLDYATCIAGTSLHQTQLQIYVH